MDLDLVSPRRQSTSSQTSYHRQFLDSATQAVDSWPKKSPFTCATCRARKVRCNGARPHCGNCLRLALPCTYDDADPDHWNVSLPRRRVKQACLNCHSRKARCSGHLPTCERCRQQKLDCVYRQTRRRTTSRLSIDASARNLNSDMDMEDGHHDDSDQALTDSPGVRTPGASQEGLVDNSIPQTTMTDGRFSPSGEESFDSIVEKTLEQFFRHVHHIPMFSFFHRASLMEEYHAKKMDKILLLALVGITSCFIDMGPGIREYGDRCIDEAENRILGEYTIPSTIKIQALVLIIKHRILSNRFPSAFMLYSTASRFATVLRLNHESPHLCFLAQESRRRLMWSLYCLDISLSGGYEEFSMWRADRIYVGLPCNERNFEFDLSQPTERLLGKPEDGSPKPHAEGVASLALHIRILYLRQRVNEFTKTAMVNRTISAPELQSGIEDLQNELDRFANLLPASFQFSENSLRLRAYSPRICIFVMIHIWWRQCHCDLYRLALTGFRDALPRSTFESIDRSFLERCQKRCAEHALAMTDIFASMQKLGAKPVSDLELAVCAAQCARMLYYAFRLDTVDLGLTSDIVIGRSKVCLEAIKQCCRGTAARMIERDLEQSISRGLGGDLASPSIVGHSGGMVPSLALPAHPALRDIQVGDEPAIIGSPVQKGSPSPRGEQERVEVSTTAWQPNSAYQTTATGLLPASALGLKSTEPLLQANNHLPTPSTGMELNNAYEGALEGLGLDNGLDHAMGVFDASRLWMSPTIDWMVQPGGGAAM